MTIGEEKGLTRKCKDCGVIFVAKRKDYYRCKDCRKIMWRERKRKQALDKKRFKPEFDESWMTGAEVF
jgi:uncharacterized OB-fold protein